MTLQDLLERLEDECRYLDDIYNINLGGCCFLAMVIAREFDLRNIKYTLIVGDDHDDKEYNSIVEEVLSQKQHFYSDRSVVGYHTCNHYYLRVGDFYINSNCGYNNEWEIPITDFTPLKWIYNHGLWNRVYDVCYNREVMTNIKLIFEEYDKSREERETY